MARSVGWATLQILPVIPGIANAINSQVSGPMKQAGQSAGATFGDAMAEGVKKSEAAVVSATKKLADERGKAAGSVRKVEIAELKLQELRETGKAKASQIKTAEDNIEKAREASNKAAGAAEAAETQLIQARKRAADAADTAANANDDLADSNDDVATSAEKAGGGLKGMFSGLDSGTKKLAGLAAGAAGLGGAMDLAGKSMEQGKLGSKMAASFGETKEEAQRYGKVAGELYAQGVGSSMEDISTAVSAVGGSFGSLDTMGSDRLVELSAKASGFAEIFDQDVSGSVQAASQLMTNGLAGSADEAFDMLTKGMQEVSVGMRDELPEILNEYGTNFRALGFDGKDAFNLLISASQGGAIALDKTGDALKEFTIRGSDMSKSSVETFGSIGLSGEKMAEAIAAGGEGAQDALQQTAAGLLKIKDPAERANAAIALFGSPLEDLSVDQIPGFLTGLAGAEDAMGDFSGSLEGSIGVLNDNEGSAFETFKRGLEQNVTNMLGDNVIPMLGNFTGALEENEGSALAAIAGMTGMSGAVAGFETAKGVFGSVADGVGQVKDQFNSAKETAQNAWSKFGDAKSFISGKNTAVTSFASTSASAVGESSKTSAAWVSSSAKSGTGWVAAKATAVASFVSKAASATTQAAVTSASWLGAQAKVAAGWTATKATAIASYVATSASATLEAVKSSAVWVASNAKTAASFLVAKVSMLAVAAATGAMTAAQWLLNVAMNANPLGLIILALVAVGAGLYLLWTKSETFRNIVSGAFDSVKNVIMGVWNWVSENWPLLLAIITGPIGMAVYLITKNWDSIKEGAGAAKDWIVGKFDELVGFVTGLPGRISNAVGGLFDGIKNSFKGAINWVIQKWNDFQIKLGGQRVNLPFGQGFTIPSITLDTPNIPMLASGGTAGRTKDGKLWGPGTGTSDSILGVNALGMPTALVSTDEGVVKKSAMDSGGAEIVAALNAGTFPAFAGGGVVGGMNSGVKDGRNSNLQVYKDWSMVPTGPKQTTMNVNPNAFGMGDAPTKGGDLFGGGTTTGGRDFSNGGGTSGGGSGGGGGDLGGAEVNTSIWNVISAKFPDAKLSSGMRPGDGGFHGIGKAVDIGGSEQTMQAVADYAFNDLRNDLAQIIWNNGPVWYNVRDNELGNGVATASGAEARAIYGEGQMAVHADHVHLAAERALKAASVSASSPSSDSSASGGSGTSGTSDKAESKTEATKVFSGRDRWKTMFTDIGTTWADASIEIAGAGEWLDLADRYTLKDSAATAESPTESTLSKAEADGAIAGTGTPDNVVRTGADLYAYEIARAAREMNLGRAAAVIGEAVAVVEAGDPMKMWANAKVPASLGMKHDAVGFDGTSTGLFQQQDNGGWGTLAQRMNPFESAKLFYSALPANWASMDPGVAAQSVQRSAFPSKYGQMMGRGADLVDNTSLFDTGGVWEPGTFGFNGLNEPELVLKDAHWKVAEANIDKVDELVGAGAPAGRGGPAVVQNFYPTVADQAGFQRVTTRRLELSMMQHRGGSL